QRARLDRLTEPESEVYDDLVTDRLARAVRLEQERWTWSGWSGECRIAPSVNGGCLHVKPLRRVQAWPQLAALGTATTTTIWEQTTVETTAARSTEHEGNCSHPCCGSYARTACAAAILTQCAARGPSASAAAGA